MTRYAVTGATGHLGTRAIQTLSKLVEPSDIVALARNVEKAKASVPEGVEVRHADYDHEDSFVKALQGVDKLLLISSQPGGPVSRQQQHQNVIDAAKADGVEFIAYTSFAHIETAKSPLANDHRFTEQAIVKSGIAHSFLRNNWYLENEAATIQAALKGQPFVYAAGEGHIGWAAEIDYADANAQVMVLEQPKEIYEFAGQSRTYAQLADVVKTVSDHDFEVQSISEAEYQKNLEASGLNTQTAAAIASLQKFIKSGDLAENSTDLQDVLKRPLTDLATVIKAMK
ncbi:SDR family oxidoreductase [Secundilactobacillus folii]|uniref:NAD(P)H-binding protein n=1 Tax=Secundilactobacillus folii TaxID=2678357 RepID=A0A7X3C1B0_9LACO|nr:SDR family oxidoreductase [Secundilactobacillus folii]MTV81540.1 NAD(P)H-binding protein [Secundilactobacillus folii]